MKKNIMVDLETLGLAKNAVILSVGACSFNLNDPPGEIASSFHMGCSIDDQIAKGRKVESSVFEWWLQQSETARGSLGHKLKGSEGTAKVLLRFSDFIRRYGPDVKLWCKGADNDIAWLASLYDDYGLSRPFAYNAIRDMRAFNELMIDSDWETTKATQAHDALDDAIAQTITMQRFHQRMGWGHS